MMEFFTPPLAPDITFAESEILKSDHDCLAVWTVLRLQGFREGETENVHVLRPLNGKWVRLGLWINRNDLWETDCESVLLES